jgi:hypothetical protein
MLSGSVVNYQERSSWAQNEVAEQSRDVDMVACSVQLAALKCRNTVTVVKGALRSQRATSNKQTLPS